MVFDIDSPGITFSNLTHSPLINFQGMVGNLSLTPSNFLGNDEWHHVCSTFDSRYQMIGILPDGQPYVYYISKLRAFVDGLETNITSKAKPGTIFPGGNMLFGYGVLCIVQQVALTAIASNFFLSFHSPW